MFIYFKIFNNMQWLKQKLLFFPGGGMVAGVDTFAGLFGKQTKQKKALFE